MTYETAEAVLPAALEQVRRESAEQGLSYAGGHTSACSLGSCA